MDDLFKSDPCTFASAYAAALHASGAQARFEASPTFANAEALALAIYNAIHDTAPDGAKVAIMYSGGKDSSAALHYFVESIIARAEAGKRYVTGSAICSSTQHEFSAMDLRQRNEISALNAWGAPYGFTAEMVTPAAKNTVMVELLGSGMALPARAKNDKIQRASISNWCVMRVKADLLDAAVERAAKLAPLVIQVLGSRFDESTARGQTMNRYSVDLPYGLTRMSARGDGEVDPRFVGVHSVGHFSKVTIRDFVHNCIPSYRPLGNLELEQIYRDMSGDLPGSEATECSIQRTADGSFAGGCSNLMTGVRSGCAICLKSVNNALKNLAEKYPARYGLTYRLQQRINRHQDLVHARPLAVKATGLTPDQVFPKGFTFTERYKMLVILMAAEIQSGERQLSDEQLSWIERRWMRHGIFTVTPADARNDARLWLNGGCVGDPIPFFASFGELAGDFTYCMGEGLSLGAYAAFMDPNQEDLNLAHLVSLGITGTPAFPQILAYCFNDRSDPDRMIVAVTDEPAVLGTRTNTGLINGMSGATLQCVGVRTPSAFELKMGDGRHFFYEVRRSQAPHYMEQVAVHGAKLPSGTSWELSDFLRPGGPAEGPLNSFLVGHAATWLDSLGEANGSHCGIDFDPVSEQFHRHEAIMDLAGKVSRQDLDRIFDIVGDQIALSETLQDATTHVHHTLLTDLRATLASDWSKLSADNDSGKALRRDIGQRLREAMFGSEATLNNYRDYVTNLKALTTMYRDGLLNTSLAVRVAFIVRSSWYCMEHAEEYTNDLLKLLGIEAGKVVPIQDAPLAEVA